MFYETKYVGETILEQIHRLKMAIFCFHTPSLSPEPFPEENRNTVLQPQRFISDSTVRGSFPTTQAGLCGHCCIFSKRTVELPLELNVLVIVSI